MEKNITNKVVPIKKGDDLMLMVNGRPEIPVVAASDEQNGFVQIKQKGTFSTCAVSDLKRAESAVENAMSNDDDMNPDMTPEEEDAAADNYRERLKRLGQLPPPTDPGEIRARDREREELERRLREHDERKEKEADATSGEVV
jgi:hypothetical protein